MTADHIPDAGKMMPKALELADVLERMSLSTRWDKQAAAELRRLHSELEATDRQVNILTDTLSRCDQQNKTLRAIADYLIRTYVVADESWNKEADTKRVMARLWKEHSK